MVPRTFGPAYDATLDEPRLTDQRAAIYQLMSDGVWRSLREISATTGYPEASISAQLRHLRKVEFGAHRVEKRRRTREGYGGTWEYCLLRGDG